MAFAGCSWAGSQLLGQRVRTFRGSETCNLSEERAPVFAAADERSRKPAGGGKRRGGSKPARKPDRAKLDRAQPLLSEDGLFERWRVFDVKLNLDEEEAAQLSGRVAARIAPCALSPAALKSLRNIKVVRRAFDARKDECKYVYVVDVDVPTSARLREKQGRAGPAPPPNPHPATRVGEGRERERVVVVGAGPAGLFAALRLARAGLHVTLLDRGKPVERRGADIGSLFHRAKLNAESNLCYGEGGAGTWSDGKLTTRVHAGEVRTVLETLVEFGAPEHILTEGKPHLGTDRLVKILKGFRAALLELDVDIRFDTKMVDLDLDSSGAVRGVRVTHTDADGDGPVEHLPADRVILGVGHSARDVYDCLKERGVAIVPKAFAVGFRIEHPQELINRIQYGSHAGHPNVPVADYRLATQVDDGAGEERAVYSFCMCPGGQIVVTSTREDELCLNGMSFSRRDSRWANSALVVSVSPSDFAAWGGADPADPLAGVAFQRAMERKAAALGGGSFRAPAQLATDFMEGRASPSLPKTSYRLGVTPERCDAIFAEPVTAALRAALLRFDRSMPGFLSEAAVLHGVETRTSAPLQVTRGEDFQSVSTPGLYPAGEGAGYAGGIVSAAVDGLRIAERIVAELSSAPAGQATR